MSNNYICSKENHTKSESSLPSFWNNEKVCLFTNSFTKIFFHKLVFSHTHKIYSIFLVTRFPIHPGSFVSVQPSHPLPSLSVHLENTQRDRTMFICYGSKQVSLREAPEFHAFEDSLLVVFFQPKWASLHVYGRLQLGGKGCSWSLCFCRWQVDDDCHGRKE